MACQLAVFVHPKQVLCVQLFLLTQERSLVQLSQSALLRVQCKGNSINIWEFELKQCVQRLIWDSRCFELSVKNKIIFLILHPCYKNLFCLYLSKNSCLTWTFHRSVLMDINSAVTPYVNCRNPACPPMPWLRKSLTLDLGQDKEQMNVSLCSCRMWV